MLGSAAEDTGYATKQAGKFNWSRHIGAGTNILRRCSRSYWATAKDPVAGWKSQHAAQVFLAEAQTIAKHLKDRCVIRIAQTRRGLNERIKRALQIEGRPADHLQDVCGGSLLFQSFGQLARPSLHLLEQPGVLHRDQRLLREGVDEG